MANELVVINTGPLILLGKAGALEIAADLTLEYICPPAVRAELEAGVRKGHVANLPEWVRVVPLKAPLSEIASAMLDRGEAEVIQLALEAGAQTVCLDDLRGRRVAVAAGLRVTGVLGLLLRAKELGIIPALRPYCDRLGQEGAWYSRALIERLLADAGE